MTSTAAPVRIRLARTTTGEEEVQAVREVLESGVLTNGPRTVEFEEVFAQRHDVAHAVAFANGTVALAAMFLALGIGEGDEVIVPSMTFISTATSVLHVGATPVFADVDPRTFNLDPESVRQRLSPAPRPCWLCTTQVNLQMSTRFMASAMTPVSRFWRTQLKQWALAGRAALPAASARWRCSASLRRRTSPRVKVDSSPRRTRTWLQRFASSATTDRLRSTATMSLAGTGD